MSENHPLQCAGVFQSNPHPPLLTPYILDRLLYHDRNQLQFRISSGHWPNALKKQSCPWRVSCSRLQRYQVWDVTCGPVSASFFRRSPGSSATTGTCGPWMGAAASARRDLFFFKQKLGRVRPPPLLREGALWGDRGSKNASLWDF